MFNQTCDRLREYMMKERGHSGLGLTLTALGPANIAPNTISPSHTRETCKTEEDMPKQMTIFYGGRVFVLENVSSSKAMEIMRLASSSSPLPADAFVRDLSQTRTRSLTRFFEKRRDRIKGRAPYALSDDSSKPVDPGCKSSWLQLAAGNQ